MSRLIRINPETWERLQHWAVPGRTADEVVRAALDQAFPEPPATIQAAGLIPLSDARLILGVSLTWLHELIRRGQLRAWRTPRRLLVSRAEVERLARERKPVQTTLDRATLGEVTCGVCGATAPFTQEVEETWHPTAYRSDQEVSPLCPEHAGHYDAEEHAFIVEE